MQYVKSDDMVRFDGSQPSNFLCNISENKLKILKMQNKLLLENIRKKNLINLIKIMKMCKIDSPNSFIDGCK